MPALAFDPTLLRTCRYAIADASQRHRLAAHWPTTVIAPAFLGQDTARSPVLVDLSAIRADELDELGAQLDTDTRQRHPTHFGLLLHSASPPAELSRHLAARLVIRPTGTAPARQFRYYDPGTFLQLPTLLGEATMAWLFGPISVVLVGWAGQWRPCPAPAADIPAARRLDAAQLDALLELSLSNRAAMQLPPPRDQDDWVARCQRIGAHLRRARQHHQLHLRDALIAFALHAERCHPRFDEHPLIVSLLQQQGADYLALTASITATQWQRIAAELADAPTPGNAPHSLPPRP